MIEALLPTQRSGTLSAEDLAALVSLSLIGDRVTYRVASESMRPTLQVGDILELGPVGGLRPGDLVVYETEAGLVCHRLRSWTEQGELFVSGDAAPSSLEAIGVSRLRGKVVAVTPRNGMALAQVARTAIRLIRWLLLSPLGLVAIGPITRLVDTSVCLRTSVQSLPLWKPVSRMRGMKMAWLERLLSGLSTDRQHIQIRVSLGRFVLGTFDGDSGHVDVGPVGCRLGIDRFLLRAGAVLDTAPCSGEPRRPPKTHGS